MSQAIQQPYHFLAPYYEQLSETRDWGAWITYVDAVLLAAYGDRPKTVLDAACGTGRVAVGLASVGYGITGVDASAAMLAQADSNSKQFGFNLPFFHQDLRALTLPGTFQAAISLCDSLNYIIDHSEFTHAIRNIVAHLEPGGLFLFDVNTDWKLQSMYGDHTYAEHRDGFSYIWENTYDRKTRQVTMRLSFFVEEGTGTGLYRRDDEMHVQRSYTHAEVLQSLSETGLDLLGWGEPCGIRPPESPKERVFYLARRPM